MRQVAANKIELRRLPDWLLKLIKLDPSVITRCNGNTLDPIE